jgi:hypothetical protein
MNIYLKMKNWNIKQILGKSGNEEVNREGEGG